MKGVVVKVGEKRSIVLFEDGRVGSIPTPQEARTGMVVRLSWNRSLVLIPLLVLLCGAAGCGFLLAKHFYQRSETSRLASNEHAVFPSETLPVYEEGGRGENADVDYRWIFDEASRNLLPHTSYSDFAQLLSHLGEPVSQHRQSRDGSKIILRYRSFRLSVKEYSRGISLVDVAVDGPEIMFAGSLTCDASRSDTVEALRALRDPSRRILALEEKEREIEFEWYGIEYEFKFDHGILSEMKIDFED